MTNKIPQKTFIIIDGHAIIHRAYHALPPMTVKDGTMVNAVYGFSSMLLKVINDFKPDYLAVSFDVAGATFRDEVYEDYKATRVKADDDLYTQIPLIYDVVQAFDIPIYTKEGFEADDVIGTVTELVKNEKVESIIVTGDKDLLQLVDDDKTKVYLLKKGMSEFDLYNEDKVEEKFGFGPVHLVDFKSLRGDSSDNIPGVRGVGEKTAVELISHIGSLGDIYDHIDKLVEKGIKESVVKKLKDGKADAFMSQELATIRRDVAGLEFSLDACRLVEFDVDKIQKLFKKFEFFSLLKRIPGSKESNMDKEKKPERKQSKKLIIADKHTIIDIIADLKKTDVMVCKEIIDSSDIVSAHLLGLVFITHHASYYIEKPDERVFALLNDETKTIVGHDIKQLLKILEQHGIMTLRCHLFDIMIASYIINSSTRAHDLKTIVLRELDADVPVGSEQSTLFGVDRDIIVKEAQLVYDVYEIYHDRLKEIDNKGLFDEIEMKLIPVLADMELQGVVVDTTLLKDLSIQVTAEIANLEKKIWKEAGQEFNVASSVQLRDILFDTLALPRDGIKKGKTGYSTAAAELEKLREYHPIISYIEDYRELEKLRNTYIDVLPTLINKKTGRIHTTFNQAVASTGRLSSSEPNLQNIPIRTELGRKVREAFVSETAYVLIAADYSQIELRIVASLANDKTMIDIFKRGEDIHTATAAVINGVKIEQVTKDMRRAAKEVNFGVLYGMGAFGLASRTGISQYEAKDFIEKYFKSFKDVKTYLDTTLKHAKKDAYVETLFGRRRYIPELQSNNYQLKNAGERMAINMPIQGTAADLMKMAMIRVSNKIQETKYKQSDVKMILQVHDEIVLEVKKDIADEIAGLVKKEMELVAKLRVPIEVDVEIGTSWGKMK